MHTHTHIHTHTNTHMYTSTPTHPHKLNKETIESLTRGSSDILYVCIVCLRAEDIYISLSLCLVHEHAFVQRPHGKLRKTQQPADTNTSEFATKGHRKHNVLALTTVFAFTGKGLTEHFSTSAMVKEVYSCCKSAM